MIALENHLSSSSASEAAQLLDRARTAPDNSDLAAMLANAFAMIDRLERDLAQLRSRANH